MTTKERIKLHAMQYAEFMQIVPLIEDKGYVSSYSEKEAAKDNLFDALQLAVGKENAYDWLQELIQNLEDVFTEIFYVSKCGYNLKYYQQNLKKELINVVENWFCKIYSKE